MMARKDLSSSMITPTVNGSEKSNGVDILGVRDKQ